jgi:flagellar biosynthesis/type III secretory pathway protein FliH
MTALIKSGAGQSIRAFAGVTAFPDAEPAVDPRDLECARLRDELVTLEARLAAIEAANAEAVRLAVERGRRAGKEEAETGESERLKALRTGMEAALAKWTGRLDAWDGLAAALAEATLSRLFEPAADWSEPVVRALARQLAVLRRDAVVAIHVSPADFAGQDALDALRQQIAPGDSVAVATDSGLSGGKCRIDCRFEQVDLDIPAHWGRLTKMLAEMANGGGT